MTRARVGSRFNDAGAVGGPLGRVRLLCVSMNSRGRGRSRRPRSSTAHYGLSGPSTRTCGDEAILLDMSAYSAFMRGHDDQL